MFNIITKYIAANLIIPFGLSSVFFIAFLLTFELFKIIKIVISKGIDIITIFQIIGHISLSFFPMAIPIATLFSAIYTMNKLSEDSEIIAMRSFGFTKFQFLKPFLFVGILIAITIFSLNRNMIPHSKKVFRNELIRISSQEIIGELRSEKFFTEMPDLTIFAEKIDKNTGRMNNIFINFKGKNENKTILAEKGFIIKQQTNTGAPAIRLHLQNGNVTVTYNKKENKDQIDKIIFQEYDFPILDSSYKKHSVNKDSMMSSHELSLKIKKMEKENKNSIYKLTRTKLELYSRINTPLQCLIFIILGLCFGIKRGRGTQRNTGLIGFIVLIGYYTVFFLGVSLSKKGLIPAEITVFAPTTIAFIVSIYYYRKLDWV